MCTLSVVMLHLHSLSTIHHKSCHGHVLSVSIQQTTFHIAFFNNSTESIDTDDLNNSSASSVSNQESSMNDDFKGITHLAEVRKSHHKTFIGGYLNINSLRYKIDSLRDILNRNYLDFYA